MERLLEILNDRLAKAQGYQRKLENNDFFDGYLLAIRHAVELVEQLNKAKS
jgi:hypothetical protein